MNEQESSKKQEGSGRSGKGDGRRMENKPEGESSTVKTKDFDKQHLVLKEEQQSQTNPSGVYTTMKGNYLLMHNYSTLLQSY